MSDPSSLHVPYPEVLPECLKTLLGWRWEPGPYARRLQGRPLGGDVRRPGANA
jgi:hypothetical protein